MATTENSNRNRKKNMARDMVVGFAGGVIGGALVDLLIHQQCITGFTATITSSGTYNDVIFSMCLSDTCRVTYQDYTGVVETTTLNKNDIVVAKTLTVESGQMYVLTPVFRRVY